MPRITADSPVFGIAFVEGGRQLAGFCGDGKVRHWDAASGSLVKTSDEAVGRPHVWVDGKPAWVTKEGAVSIGGARLLPPVLPRATDLAVAAGGSRVATAHMPDRQTGVNVIRVRDGAGKDLQTLTAGIGGVSILGFSPDGATLIAGSFDCDVRVWSVRSGELLRREESLLVAMFAMAFSPDGRWLATAGVDRVVHLWDTGTWRLARKIEGQPELIAALDFSLDGKRIVTGGFDDRAMANPVKAIVWDAATGRRLVERDAPHAVYAAVFAPDGKSIAASYGRTYVDVWPA